jgi:hypothetical protein
MKRRHCLTCNQVRSFKRRFGVGALVAVLMTAGVWLLALPLYRSRCTACGTAGGRAVVPWRCR